MTHLDLGLSFSLNKPRMLVFCAVEWFATPTPGLGGTTCGVMEVLPETDADEDIQECMDSERSESAYDLWLAMDGVVVEEPHECIESERNGSFGRGPVILQAAA